MTEGNKNLLSTLIKISKIDSALAGIGVDRKRIETDIANRAAALQKLKTEEHTKVKALEERRTRYQKEERYLKDERQKLTDRRKELSSHTNYKLQQAADKEIDYSMRQLNLREEGLIKVLDEFETLDKAVKEIQERIVGIKGELESAQKDAQETFVNFDERIRDYAAQREELVRTVDSASVTIYSRVRDKYPSDPVVSLDGNGSCTGCFMQLGPQIMVQISRGDSLVKCKGCGRIVYYGNSNEE